MSHQPLTFYRRAAAAAADTTLQAKLQRATARLTSSRQASFAAWPEGDAVRDHARAFARIWLRIWSVSAQFEAAVTARGGHVHWAADCRPGRRHRRRYRDRTGCRTAVKSKSMVSEEIELNDASRLGVDVLETDLASSSFSSTAIIHRTSSRPSSTRARGHRGAVQTAAGATDDDVSDVAHMTAFARRRLRSEFIDGRHGHQRRQLRRGRDAAASARHQRGQRPPTTTLPRSMSR